jgi:glucokinase
VAVAIPSFAEGGAVLDVPSLPALTGTRLGDLIAARTGAARVELVPDLAAAALGEQRLGSGRGVDRFLCVALGTGANAAAVVGGAVVDTAFGCLGDAGHIKVEADGPGCPCGGRG